MPPAFRRFVGASTMSPYKQYILSDRAFTPCSLWSSPWWWWWSGVVPSDHPGGVGPALTAARKRPSPFVGGGLLQCWPTVGYCNAGPWWVTAMLAHGGLLHTVHCTLPHCFWALSHWYKCALYGWQWVTTNHKLLVGREPLL